MELDELKMAWGQFNDKINGQELVGRQQLKQMLAKKKMSNYSSCGMNEYPWAFYFLFS